MAVGLNSVQLLVLSGLLQDKGLRVPVALTDRINKLKDTSKLSGRLGYIAWHPQSSVHMTSIRTAIRESLSGLAAVVPASYTRTLPEGLRVLDVVGSVKTRADNLLGNGLKGLLENIVICAGELQKSFDVQGSLDTYKNAKFSDIYLNAKNYTDVISHGLAASFGSSATGTPAQQKAQEAGRTVSNTEISTNIAKLSAAIKGLSKLYDWEDLNSVGTAYNFVKNIYKIGAAYNTEVNNLMTQYGYSVDSIGTSDTIALTQMLQRITGRDIGIILKASGATVPNVNNIDSAADFLIAAKVLPSDVADMLPNRDLTQLGKKLINLGVNSTNIASILDALAQIQIVELGQLNQLTRPIPSFDANVIQSTLISGQGQFNNATLDDLLGVLTGNNYNQAMDAIIEANNYFTKADTGSTLMTTALSIVDTLKANGTVTSTQATNFVTAATAFKTAIANAKAISAKKVSAGAPVPRDSFWHIYEDAEAAVVLIIDRLRQEIVNGEILNLQIEANIQVTSSNTTIDTFDIRNIRKAHYTIEVQNADKFDDFEAKVVHNGTLANLVVLNRVLVGTNVSLGNIYATVNAAANTCTISYAAASDNNAHYFLRPRIEYTPIHDGSDPRTLRGSSSEISAVYQLDEIAVDRQYSGIGTLLESMANADIYGEAILASLVTSRNANRLQSIGINGQRADPQERLNQILAKQGQGLTEKQKRAILKTAAEMKTDPNVAIANASRHGFFSDYYSKKGNFD